MSNIIHSLTEARVCLRCRLRLISVITQPCTVRLRPTVLQSRSFSFQPKRTQEHGHIDNSFANEQNPLDNPFNFPSDSSYEKDDIKLPSDADFQRHPTDGGGIYMRRARLYSRRALGITTLGKPSEVLRLQDAAPQSSEKKWWLMQPQSDGSPNPEEPLTSSDILERVASERGLVSPSRAKGNINRLKQEWLSVLKQPDHPPSESDCHELGKRMYRGFTLKQLLGYINETSIAVSTDLTDLNTPFRSALLTRSEWEAGVTPFPGKTAKRLQTLSLEPRNNQESGRRKTYSIYTLIQENQGSKAPIKFLLVNKIMRQCWNIRPKEELESIGEVDVQIPEAYLELINSHEWNGLHRVAAEFDAKIDVSKAESVLRITANYATCVSALKFLSLILDEAGCYEMSIQDLSSSLLATNYRTLLNDQLLREVEKLSSTVIRWSRPISAHMAKASPEKVSVPAKESSQVLILSKLLIYYLKTIGKSYVDAKVLLDQSLRPKRDIATSVYFGGDKPTFANLIAVPVEIGRSLPLPESGVSWARKSQYSHESYNSDQDVKHESKEHVFEKTLTAIKQQLRVPDAWGNLRDRFGPDAEFWRSSPFREMSVSFGRLLYPLGDITSKKKPDTLVNKIDGHHVFSTEVPGIRRTLELREVKILEVRDQLCLRMNATHKSTENESEQQSLPDIELRFRLVPEDQQTQLESVRLILEEKQADLLLPHEQADLRFATQTYLIAKDKIDPRILEFVKSIDLQKWEFNQPDRSQILTVGIPQQVLFPDKDARQENHSEKLIDYSLGNIERRSIAYGRPTQGRGEQQFQLSLATIDNGPIGGRRQEFRLFEDRALEFVRKSAVKGLYVSAHRIIEDLRTESRRKIKPASPKSRKRMRRIVMGYKSTKGGRRAILRRQSNIIRRRFTDVPQKAAGSTGGRSRGKAPIRRVQAARWEPANLAANSWKYYIVAATRFKIFIILRDSTNNSCLHPPETNPTNTLSHLSCKPKPGILHPAFQLKAPLLNIPLPLKPLPQLLLRPVAARDQKPPSPLHHWQHLPSIPLAHPSPLRIHFVTQAHRVKSPLIQDHIEFASIPLHTGRRRQDIPVSKLHFLFRIPLLFRDPRRQFRAAGGVIYPHHPAGEAAFGAEPEEHFPISGAEVEE
ncbi:MAG: hypothetical protein Q9216_006501 [Gyalolechia sp. 2 TL-2023]